MKLVATLSLFTCGWLHGKCYTRRLQNHLFRNHTCTWMRYITRKLIQDHWSVSYPKSCNAIARSQTTEASTLRLSGQSPNPRNRPRRLDHPHRKDLAELMGWLNVGSFNDFPWKRREAHVAEDLHRSEGLKGKPEICGSHQSLSLSRPLDHGSES